MKFFKKKTEKRSEEITPPVEDNLLKAINPDKMITPQQALNIPVVYACIDYIAKNIAMLPIKLYSEDNGEVTELSDYRVTLLNDATGDTLNAYQMKKAFVRDSLLYGAGYIYVNRNGNKIRSLHYVAHKNVSVLTNNQPIFKYAEFLVQDIRIQDYEMIKLTHNTENGVSGTGIVEEVNTALTALYNEWSYEKVITQNGGNKKGFLQSEKKLAQPAIDALKSAWRDLYSNNHNNMMILNDGIKFQESSNTLVEMQLNENKKNNAEEICRIFNLSVDVISGKATEEEYVSSFKTAILPELKNIETELNKILLLESEKANHYFAFDTTESMKGDMLKRYQAYQIALNANFMQPDEIRYKEDLKPLGLDFIKLGLNDVLYNPKTKSIYTPNTNKSANIDDMKGEKEDEN